MVRRVKLPPELVDSTDGCSLEFAALKKGSRGIAGYRDAKEKLNGKNQSAGAKAQTTQGSEE